MGQAIDYALAQWPMLKVYLQDGRVEIDNNLVENAIRPTAIGCDTQPRLVNVTTQSARRNGSSSVSLEGGDGALAHFAIERTNFSQEFCTYA
jgi:hypothetical protein